jgi:hypothetical protein
VFCTRPTRIVDFYTASSETSPRVDMSLHSTHYPDSEQTRMSVAPQYHVLGEEAVNTNINVCFESIGRRTC